MALLRLLAFLLSCSPPPSLPPTPKTHSSLFRQSTWRLDLDISFPAFSRFPRRIMCVKDAEGACDLKTMQHKDGKAILGPGPSYDRLYASQARRPGQARRHVTFVWMQANLTPSRSWRSICDSLRGLIEQLAGDIARPDLKRVIGRISDAYNKDPNRPDWLVLSARSRSRSPSPVGRARWIDTDDLNDPGNAFHETRRYKELGRRFALPPSTSSPNPQAAARLRPSPPSRRHAWSYSSRRRASPPPPPAISYDPQPSSPSWLPVVHQPEH